jgi:CBS domain-containing protein
MQAISGEPVSVPPSASVLEVARKMSRSRNGVVLVCNDGKLSGLITERDIVVNAVAKGLNLERVHAREIMKRNHPVVSAREELLEAAKMMVEKSVRLLPVLKGGKAVGVITVEDLAKESVALASLVWAKTASHAPPESIPMETPAGAPAPARVPAMVP